MNTKYTRQMNVIRRALGIGALCLVASVGFVHAESIAIPSARPMIDGIGADVETISSSTKVQHHVSADVVTPNDWTYTALQHLSNMVLLLILMALLLMAPAIQKMSSCLLSMRW